MAKARKYTDQEFIDAVKTSTSLRQVLSKLGLREAGGNYNSCRDRIHNMQLDILHFTGQGWNKGKKTGPKRPIEDYLSNKHAITSHALRLRLLKEEYFQHVCVFCNRKKWLGKLIPLELDHIDGNHKNNNLDNLRLLCPNCHALTSTYRGKNIGRQEGSRTPNQ